MDQSISAVLGALIFSAFVLGLAESIGSIPFFVIVSLVVGFMGFETYQFIKEVMKSENSEMASR